VEKQRLSPGRDAALLDAVGILTRYGEVTEGGLQVCIQEVDTRPPVALSELAKRVEDVNPHTARAKAYTFVWFSVCTVDDHAPGARGRVLASGNHAALQAC